jgi:hypothetical protein
LRAKFGIITFRIFTPIPIREYYVRDYFVRYNYMAPELVARRVVR